MVRAVTHCALVILLLASLATAALATARITYTFNIPAVQAEAYNCLDSHCDTVAAFSGTFPSGTSTATGSLRIDFPTNLAVPNGYAVYYFTPGYVPMEYRANWYGNGATSFPITFGQIAACRSVIDSFTVTNDARADVPLVITTSASLDANTRSAFTLIDNNLGYVPPARAQEYYSADVRVRLVIRDASGAIVNQQERNFTAATGEALFADTSRLVQFSWTPTVSSNYTATVTTTVIDNQCSSTDPQSSSQQFEVLGAMPRNQCYTILNGLQASPQPSQTGQAVNASFTKLSNHANDFLFSDPSYLLTPVATALNYTVTGPAGTVATGSFVTPANPTSGSPTPQSFQFTPTVAGDHTIAVTGLASAGICAGLANVPVTIAMQYTINAPQQYTISFHIINGNTGGALPGASIAIANQTLTTNANGDASITLAPGTYAYTVTAAGFIPLSSTAILGQANLQVVQVLQPLTTGQPGTVTFVVTNALTNAPLAGASIALDSLAQLTGVTGRVTYTNVANGVHNWTAALAGFIGQAGTVTVAGNAVTVAIAMVPSNGAPVIQALPPQTLLQNTPGSFDVGPFASDPNNDPLTFNVVSENIAAVDCSFTGSVLQMTPATNFVGNATCNVTATDGTLTSNIAVLAIQVVGTGNGAPVLAPLTPLTLPEDSPATLYDLTPFASDPNNDPLIALVISSGAGVSCVASGGLGVFVTPNLNFFGNTSCLLAVFDGSSTSNTRILNITVTPVNDAPVANNDSATTGLNVPVTLDPRLNDTDVEGDPLTVLLAGNGSNGIVTFTGTSVTYTPNTGFNGTDVFSYTITDGALTASAFVTVTVNATNIPPIARNDTVVTFEDTPVSFDPRANDTDANGDALSITAVGVPANGVATFIATSINYTPNLDFFGTDSFTYTISDGNTTATATITIIVIPVQDAPVARNDSLNTSLNTPATIDPRLNDTDADGDVLTITLATNGTNGNVSFTGGSVTYTPNFNFAGVDQFSYTITDGNASATAFVDVLVQSSVQLPPIAVNDSISTPEDVAVTFDPRANDVDPNGDVLTIIGVGTANNGSVTFTGLNVTYTPNLNFFGNDTFNYTISDGNATATAWVRVNVLPVNDAPTALNDSVITAEDTNVTFDPRVNDTDVDGDAIFVTGVTNGQNGTVTMTATSVTYTPALNFFGTDSFNYTISDGALTSTATVFVTVTPVQDAPVAANDSVVTPEDTPVTFDPRINDTDVDGDVLTVTLATNGTNGNVSFTGTSITYTPNLNFFGSDSFTYTITDGNASASATIFVTVTPVQDAPVANPDLITTAEDTNITFNPRVNDTDADGDVLNITATTSPANGSVTFSGTSITYAPALNFFGTDTFNYTISDGNASSTSSVTVTVTPVNDAPVAFNDSAVTPEDTPVTLDPRINDTDVDGDALTVVGVGSSPNGNVSFTASNVTFTPNLNFFGNATFNYTISDGALNATAFITVNVQPVDDAPVILAQPGAITMTQNTSATLDLTAIFSDPDGSTLNYTANFTGVNVSIVINQTTGIATFTPTTNFVGNQSLVLSFIATDGTSQVSTNASDINVIAVPFFPLSVVVNSVLNGAAGITQTNTTPAFLAQFNVFIYSSNLTNSSIDIAGNTNINSSTLLRTTVVNSYVRDSVTVRDSSITNSILDRCTVINSTVKNIVASDCNFQDSVVDPPTGTNDLTGSNVSNGSTIIQSNVTFSIIDNSTITNSSITQTRIYGCYVDRSVITNSYIDKCLFIRGITLINGTIINDTLINGTFTFNGTNYTGPFPVNLSEIMNIPPVAAFTPASASIAPGGSVSFTDTSTDRNIPGSLNDTLSYSWNFGGQGSSTSQNPSFTFNNSGGFTITLTVTDRFGETSQASGSVSVNTPGSGSSGGGGGGSRNRGDGGGGPRTILLNFTNGTAELDVQQTDSLAFTEGNTGYAIIIVTVGDGFIIAELDGERRGINVGSVGKWDIDEDGFYDIVVELVSTTGGIAHIRVSRIHEKIEGVGVIPLKPTNATKPKIDGEKPKIPTTATNATKSPSNQTVAGEIAAVTGRAVDWLTTDNHGLLAACIMLVLICLAIGVHLSVAKK